MWVGGKGASPRAVRLAETFRGAIEHTAYYREAMLRSDSLSAEVVDEYSQAACLCRLDDHPEERKAIRAALFELDPGDPASGDCDDEAGQANDGEDGGDTSDAIGTILTFSGDMVTQRRGSFGHFLTLVANHPGLVDSIGVFREALWEREIRHSEGHVLVADEWAALIAKDVWQDALCSVWTEFCRTGLALSRDLDRGLTEEEVRALVSGLAVGLPALDPLEATADVRAKLIAGELVTRNRSGNEVDLRGLSIEELRLFAVTHDTAAAGLLVLLELDRRTGDRSGPGWNRAAHAESNWQPSVAAVLAGLHAHIESVPTVAATLWWLVSTFVLPVHQWIAYSKLPEFTFRFRWEDGYLAFYDHGLDRFPLAAIRHEPMGSLTEDLGLWERGSDGTSLLTPTGESFVLESLS
jgi:hypothetical protein